MSLFIDYHQLEEGLTIEDVRQAHKQGPQTGAGPSDCNFRIH